MRPVRVEMRKWPDSPHWEFDAVALGADRHGHWVGIPRGTVLTSPQRVFTAAEDHVTLVPYDDWWVGTCYGADDRGRPFDVYVDITTPATWSDEGLVRCVDLDLDVIRGVTGRVFVDDEDEFARHRVQLGYPPEVVDRAVEAAARLEAQVRAGRAPFDPVTSAEWLARFRRHRADAAS